MTTSQEPLPAEPQAPLAAGSDSSGRARGIVTGLLVVLTSLSILVASIGVWAHNVLLNTDKFMETVEPALEEPALYAALGDRISTQVLEALDLETRIATSLAQLDDFLFGALIDALEVGDRGQAILNGFDRPSLEDLAPTVASGLEERITTRIDNFVNSPELRARIPDLARRAHEATVALVRGEFTEIPNVSVQDGEVILNLIPIIGEAIRTALPDLNGLGPDITLPDRFSERAAEARQQLEAAVGAQLPEDFGQLTVMSEARLTEVQDGVVMLDRMMWGLVALAVILLIVTLVVSRTRRRTTIQLAIGVLVGLLLAEATLRWVEGQIVDSIVDLDTGAAASEIIGDVLSGLRQGAVLVGVVALVLGFAAYLSGRPAWAMRVKDETARLTAQTSGGSVADRWVASRYDLIRGVGVGIALIAVFLLGITLVGVLVVGAVLALFIWAISEMRKRAAAPVEAPVSL